MTHRSVFTHAATLCVSRHVLRVHTSAPKTPILEVLQKEKKRNREGKKYKEIFGQLEGIILSSIPWALFINHP